MKSDTGGGGGGKGKVSKKYRCDSEAVGGGWVAAMATAGHVVAASEQTRTHPPPSSFLPRRPLHPPIPPSPRARQGHGAVSRYKRSGPSLSRGWRGNADVQKQRGPAAAAALITLSRPSLCVCVYGGGVGVREGEGVGDTSTDADR